MYLWNSEFPSIVLLGCLPEQGCEKLVVVLTRDMEYRKADVTASGKAVPEKVSENCGTLAASAYLL